MLIPMKEQIRSFFNTTFFCLLAASALNGQNPMLPATQTRAVIVGISDYQNITDLDYAHRDALALADYLKSPAGGNVPEENIRLMLNEEATQMEIGMALHWLREESQEGDRAYIYFSGHGDVESETIPQSSFLLAYDAPSTTYIAGGVLSIDLLQGIIKKLSAEKQVEVIMVADACRAGNLAGEAIGGRYITTEKLAENYANEIRILSCRKNELSQEDNRLDGGRGIFSYYLIEGLIGLADQSGDSEVNLWEIKSYLENKVRQQTDGKQNPFIDGDLNQSLVKVDAESLERLRKKKAQEVTEGIVAINNRGNSVIDPDTIIWRLYQDFNKSIQNKHLLFPADGAAYTLYEQIKEEELIRPYRNDMKRKLAVALHDEVQQAINNYLKASPQELKQRWAYDDRYQHYPEYLGTAAKLLGADHFMHDNLKTRQLYFEGLCLRLEGEKEEKKSLFQTALQKQEEVVLRDPAAAYAYNEIGLLYRRLDRKEEAFPYFLKANEYSPTWLLPMVNLMANYNDLKQTDAALTIGRKALEVDSTFALTHHNIGNTYEIREEWSKAIIHYKKAIELNPDYTDTYYNLGLVYYFTDELEKTEDYWLQYSQKVPKEASIWSDLGLIANLQDKPFSAVEYFEKALDNDPEHADTYWNMGEFYLKNNDLDRAEKAFREYLKRKMNEDAGHYMLAAVLARKGKMEEALDRLQIAVEKGFEDAEKLAGDPNFNNLQQQERFQKLSAGLRE